MKNKLFAYSALFALIALITQSCNQSTFRYPADFEHTAATYFTWSTDFYNIIPSIACTISQKDKVVIFYNSNSQDTASINKVLRGYTTVNFENISLAGLKNDPSNSWIRDYCPVFLINGKGEQKLVSFNYFGKEHPFPGELSRHLGLELEKSKFNSTGGAREVNGKGTMLLCEPHELDVNNPYPKEQIEKELKEKLNLKKIIWLKHGLPQDDSFLSGPLVENIYPKGVNGHVDEFCRFADDHTILITYVSDEEASKNPIYAETKRRMDENYKVLLDAKDQNGNHFKLIKVPPAPLRIHDRRQAKEGQIVASVTSYLNFIVSNSYVIIPSYKGVFNNNKEEAEKENQVARVFQEAFPDREIIMMNSEILNMFSGGFHCVSYNAPEL